MLQLENKEYYSKYVKGNIKINKELLNKYDNVKKIFEKEQQNFKKFYFISYNIIELKNKNIKNLKIEEIKKIANNIFNNNHSKNIFVNNKNNILVSKTGISESIEKIYNNYSQRELLIEHLKIFAYL